MHHPLNKKVSGLIFICFLFKNDSNALKLAKELNQTLIDQKIAFNKLSSVAMILLALNHNDYQFAYETVLTLEKKAFGNQLNAAERNLKVIYGPCFFVVSRTDLRLLNTILNCR